MFIKRLNNCIQLLLNRFTNKIVYNIIKDNTKDEVIATFLSLLELIKAKEIVVVQENFFEDIIIKKNLEN